MSGGGLVPGKLPAALLSRLLRRHARAERDVKLGPEIGEDAAVIDIADGALVVGADPITLTGNEVGALAVRVNANDVAVMGVRPRWFLAVVLLPPGTTEAEVEAIFAAMGAVLDEMGIALVGGHTEVTGAVTQPLVVGQMLGWRADGRFVATGTMRAGDAVLQVGMAPVEGAAVLAAEAAGRLGEHDPEILDSALRAVDDPGISVVEPALLAAELGATALHDPTEGGLSAGLHELAAASGLAIEIDSTAVPWFPPGLAICRALDADPWGTLASGALLAAFPPDRAEAARAALAADGRPAAIIGWARAGAGVRKSDATPLPRHERDEVSRILATFVS